LSYFDTRPTNGEKDVLKLIKKYKEITSSDVSKELDISKQQAFNLLDGLVSKEYGFAYVIEINCEFPV